MHLWKGIRRYQSDVATEPNGDGAAGWSAPWRWLIGSVVLVPMLLAAGVYWLHHQPAGITARGSDSTIHVELIPTSGPVAELKQAAVQAVPPIADFRTVPRIVEPVQPLVEPEAPQPQQPVPVRPAPAAKPQPASTGQGQPAPSGAAFRFQRQLLAHIARYQRYPKGAGRDGLQGTVLVVFVMRRDGSIAQIAVKSSSGRPVFDQEAMETVRRAQPLPQIPADMPEQLTVLLPVAFDPDAVR